MKKNKNKEKKIYKLSILKEETEDRFYGKHWAEDNIMQPKRWNEYVGFDLTSEEVIEILAVISRMRGINV